MKITHARAAAFLTVSLVEFALSAQEPSALPGRFASHARTENAVAGGIAEEISAVWERSHVEFLKQLAWMKVSGLTDARQPDETAFILHLHFRDDATAKALLQRLGGKDGGSWRN